MNTNLIFKWLKDERYAPDADAVFLPVEVKSSTSVVPALAANLADVQAIKAGADQFAANVLPEIDQIKTTGITTSLRGIKA